MIINKWDNPTKRWVDNYWMLDTRDGVSGLGFLKNIVGYEQSDNFELS